MIRASFTAAVAVLVALSHAVSIPRGLGVELRDPVPPPPFTIAPGVEMPAVSIGHPDANCTHGRGPGCADAAYNMTLNWLSIGGRGIDTAFAYDNQAQIGSAIKASGVDRSTLFITTKIMPSPCTQEAALAAVKVDIQQLGLEKLDLVLHHFPCDTDAENEAVWAGLVQAKQLGLTRTIGVSHYSVQNLQALMATTPTETPSVNQCQLSVGSHDDATIAFCKSKGITYESFSPLRSVNLADNRLVAVAQAHGVSTAQVALRWVIQLGCPLATSPGENTEYAKEDLGIGNFTLTSAEMSTISAI